MFPTANDEEMLTILSFFAMIETDAVVDEKMKAPDIRKLSPEW